MAYAVNFCKMLHFTLVLLLPMLAIAQPYRNVSLGSYLIANNSNSAWLSPSGDFAFGFLQIVPDGSYLLAIWFESIPEKNIIWSANRDKPAAQGSKFQISSDGIAELDDPRGQSIWTPDLASSAVAYGAMLDTGNFVLVGDTSALLWQSFNYPTDTILPAQILNKGRTLVSSFSETNYSRGRFMFALQPDGNLVSYVRVFPMDDHIGPYWASDTVDSGFQLIFNQSGYIFLTSENGTILNFLSSNGASSAQYYQRATLDYDGVLRHYVYPKLSNSTGGRPMSWSVSDLLPENICHSIPLNSAWGACGFNSICSIDRKPYCFCPNGYSLVNPSDKMSGCKQDFVAQICDQESQDASLFTFVDMRNTNFPGGDYITYRQVQEDWCRQDCLNDCLCAVAFYGEDEVKGESCWKKGYPLTNGRIDSSIRGKALIKVRKSNATLLAPPANIPNKSKRSTLIITGSVLLGSLVFVNVFLLVAFLLFCFHSKPPESKILDPYSANIRSFTFQELQEATNGFKEELGRGACSTVYKGTLKDENDGLVAVKNLNKIAKDSAKELKAEVNSISRTNHKNLVKLLGYCNEGENRLLVYQYMSNGSIASFLFQNSRPNWYQRVEIAFGTARGLCYLHEECCNQIIHCDIKPQNVLLDEAMVAKISDFGLAKLLRDDQTRTTTMIRGTRGYVAPEWFRNKPITAKVDVYSFGILLLEIICCRRKVETRVTNQNEEILADWAYDCYKYGELHLLVSNDEEAKHDFERFKKFVMVAIWCIQEDPSLRPNMKRVLHMLEGSIEVPLPPDPESFI